MMSRTRWAALRRRWSRLSAGQRTIFVAAMLFMLAIAGLTARDATRYAGLDLRCKTTGARAILRGLNPYNFPWKPGDAPELCDPWRRIPGPTRTTYPPPLELLYVPLANVAYGLQRVLWYGLEWIAMLLTLILGMRVATGRPAGKIWFFAVAVFLFVGDMAWRLHLERGQYYIFVTLLLMMAFAHVLAHEERLTTALALGTAIAFRPTFGLIAVLLFLGRRRRLALQSLAVAALLCLVTVPIVGVDGWRAYFKLVAYHSALHPLDVLQRDFGPELSVSKVAEGIDFAPYLQADTGNVSFRTFYVYWLRGTRLSYESLGRLLAVVTAILAGAAAWWAGRRRLAARWLLVLALLGTLVVEFFVAPERNAYGDVLLLPFIALLAPVWRRLPALVPAGAIALAACTLASSHVGFATLLDWPVMGPVMNWLRNLGVLGGAALALAVAFWSATQARRRRPT